MTKRRPPDAPRGPKAPKAAKPINGGRSMKADDYDVGYGKPPTSGRFKKGQSGNPKGRKKKEPQNYARLMSTILDELVAVQQNGKVIYITQREALLRTAIASSIKSKKPSDQVAMLQYLRKVSVLHWDQQYQDALHSLYAQREPDWTDEMEAALQAIPPEYRVPFETDISSTAGSVDTGEEDEFHNGILRLSDDDSGDMNDAGDASQDSDDDLDEG